VVLIPASILSIMELTEFTFHITREDGYDRTISKKISSLTATRTNPDAPISPDGILQPDEWKGALEVQLGEKQYVASGSTPWGGMNDHSALQYVKWDDENLYLAVEVTDDVHSMEVADVYGSWGSDSLQLSFDPLRAAGYGADSNHIRFIASYNANTNVSALGVESWGPIAGAGLNDIHYKFTRDEDSKKTTYELAFPWKAILTADRLPAKADFTDMGISVLVNDNDTNGRKGWLKYMDGIATGKDPSQFGDLILTDATSLFDTPEPVPIGLVYIDDGYQREYWVGDKLNLEQIHLGVVMYDGGSNQILPVNVTQDMTSGYDMNEAGNQSATISYMGFSIQYEFTVFERIAVTSVKFNGNIANIDFTCLSKQGDGYTVYLSTTGEPDSFAVYDNVHYNPTGVQIKGLDKNQTYYVYIEYKQAGAPLMRSQVLTLIHKK
jgi:hypothetical protein